MEKRGIPDYNSPVHLIRQDNHNMYCYYGSWHVFYTDNRKEVTCKKCLEKLRGKPCIN